MGRAGWRQAGLGAGGICQPAGPRSYSRNTASPTQSLSNQTHKSFNRKPSSLSQQRILEEKENINSNRTEKKKNIRLTSIRQERKDNFAGYIWIKVKFTGKYSTVQYGTEKYSTVQY